MPDFLISFNNKHKGPELLELLKKPYGGRSVEGQYLDFAWGSAAVLYQCPGEKNIHLNNGHLFAWVGELVSEAVQTNNQSLAEQLKALRSANSRNIDSLKDNKFFEKLNGAFAVFYADESGVIIITDPLSFIQLYAAADKHDYPISIGTHPDLTSVVTDDDPDIDYISAAEFLDSGRTAFPSTMYKNIKQLSAGRCYIIKPADGRMEMKDFVYWSPPAEIKTGIDEQRLCEELADAIISAVRCRCKGGKTAVLLSGGIDSRLVMAAVPDRTDCTALTFCNSLNRETATAERIAKCLNRPWQVLYRDSEFLAKSTADIVGFIGCESEWVNAHPVGFEKQIRQAGFDNVLSGYLFDTYLKGFYCYDMVRLKRLAGLLPPKFERRSYDYSARISDFAKQNLKEDILKGLYERRAVMQKSIEKTQYSSAAEKLHIYPFSQSTAAAFWTASRRVLPLSLIAADRDLVDFAFKCPAELKLNKRIFEAAARKILGNCAKIPSANDGVTCGSGHIRRLVQRTIRRLSEIPPQLAGFKKVQHSWYDYQQYRQKSKCLAELINRYGGNIRRIDSFLFRKNALQLLKDKNTDWRFGFRLLQMSIWLGMIQEYRRNVRQFNKLDNRAGIHQS